MYKFVCSGCGTECSTPKPGETPSTIYWSDGHSCTFIPVENPAQVEIIQLKAEMAELKADLNQDDTSTMLGKMKLKLDKLENAFLESIGEKILEKYGGKEEV